MPSKKTPLTMSSSTPLTRSKAKKDSEKTAQKAPIVSEETVTTVDQLVGKPAADKSESAEKPLEASQNVAVAVNPVPSSTQIVNNVVTEPPAQDDAPAAVSSQQEASSPSTAEPTAQRFSPGPRISEHGFSRGQRNSYRSDGNGLPARSAASAAGWHSDAGGPRTIL